MWMIISYLYRNEAIFNFCTQLGSDESNTLHKLDADSGIYRSDIHYLRT